MSTFPHPAYTQHVLYPAYQDAAEHLFHPMLAANRAHAVMLAKQGIISAENAQALLQAITQIEQEGLATLTYQPGVEDLFFRVEGRLIELIGAEHGGNLQLARSRNDLGHALDRLAYRPNLLAIYERLLTLRNRVHRVAKQHLETVMPGYTHTQPAQPTTFAHYLAGVLSFLERDTRRLQHAYQINNHSPLGAAAFTGTGFPIDRQLSANLLGFQGVIISSHDSIGASDHLTDMAASLMSLGTNLSRMTKDMLFWATRESGAIRIDDSFIQISSIMPQKRNPVVLEHLRARLSRLLGHCQTVYTQCHNIPYGDTQDIEDEIHPPMFGALTTASDILHLYTAVFDTLTLNVAHLRAEASLGFTTVTELADTLVREAKLPFRTAHHIVAQLVRQAIERNLAPTEISPALLLEISQDLLPEPLHLSAETLHRALDPIAFIAARTTLGGAAPTATNELLQNQAKQLQTDTAWFDHEQARLTQAAAQLEQHVAQMLETA